MCSTVACAFPNRVKMWRKLKLDGHMTCLNFEPHPRVTPDERTHPQPQPHPKTVRRLVVNDNDSFEYVTQHRVHRIITHTHTHSFTQTVAPRSLQLYYRWHSLLRSEIPSPSAKSTVATDAQWDRFREIGDQNI